MVDKERIIIIFYIDTSNIDIDDAYEYINAASKSLNSYFDDTVKTLFMPSDENRVECINPVLLNEEEYKKVSDTVEKFEVEFNKWLEEHGAK